MNINDPEARSEQATYDNPNNVFVEDPAMEIVGQFPRISRPPARPPYYKPNKSAPVLIKGVPYNQINQTRHNNKSYKQSKGGINVDSELLTPPPLPKKQNLAHTLKKPEPPRPQYAITKKDSYSSTDSEEDSCFQCDSKCIFIICLCLLVFLFAIILSVVAMNSENDIPTFLAAETEPPTTISPTIRPIILSPTISPSFNPSSSPTTDSPTESPTQKPTNAPTESPTTTLFFVSTVCQNSSREGRTSLCLSDSTWVRCEKDGTVKPLEDEYVRQCEPGDVCPCSSFTRVDVSDPCVLEADAEDSQATCISDIFT